MTTPFKFVEDGARCELYSPTAMPSASSFLWNRSMMLQLNCRGYATAQHMQPEPCKYSHAPIMEHKTFMQPEQPYYAHHPGRFVYLRNNTTNQQFSAPYEPCRTSLDKFVFSAGHSDVRWHADKDDIAVEMQVALPLNDVAELWTVTVKNGAEHAQDISLYPCFIIGYMSWMNQSAHYSETLGGVVAKSITPYQKVQDYPHIKSLKDMTVLLHDHTPNAWDTRKDAFEGEGGIHAPDGLKQRLLSNSDAIYETPIAALQYDAKLQPGESKTLRFVFAPVRDEQEAKELQQKFLCPGGFEAAAKEVSTFFADNEKTIHIDTPDESLNHFVNHWLARQVFYHGDTNRLTTDPQTRNYLQDSMGMAFIESDHTRDAILRTLSQQKEDGALPEGVVLPGGTELKYINQVPHTDHAIWLPIVLQAYLSETADVSLLTTVVHDAQGLSQPAYQRISRAMRWLANNRDHRNLSFIAQGDWCDPLNMAGYLGEGVSGWLSIACVHSLTLWADMLSTWSETAELGNARSTEQEMREAAGTFKDAAQTHLWDGQWFARGISDSGRAFGVQSDEEGKMWLNPQSWALLGNIASDEQKRQILSAVDEHIATPFGPVLLAPAYTHMHEHIGRVTQKQPGSAENGAIYSHAATFYIAGLFNSNEPDRAFEQLRNIIPGGADGTWQARGQLPVFVPNYYRGAVKQLPRTAGRSSQLFNTGACSWLYRIIIEQMFGLKGEKEGLSVQPQLPSHWDTACFTRRFRGATFDVQYQRDQVCEQTTVRVDDEVLNNNVIKDIEKGRHYSVTVTLPEANKVH